MLDTSFRDILFSISELAMDCYAGLSTENIANFKDVAHSDDMDPWHLLGHSISIVVTTAIHKSLWYG